MIQTLYSIKIWGGLLLLPYLPIAGAYLSRVLWPGALATTIFAQFITVGPGPGQHPQWKKNLLTLSTRNIKILNSPLYNDAGR